MRQVRAAIIYKADGMKPVKSDDSAGFIPQTETPRR